MTELSFLIDLLLNHKLPKPTKEAVAERLKTVEANLMFAPMRSLPQAILPQPVGMPPQAQSTLAAMARHAAAANEPYPAGVSPQVTPATDTPVAVIGQTPAAIAAMNSRQAAISAAISGKPEKGATRPRKF